MLLASKLWSVIMMKLNAIESELLKNIADLHKIPTGAFNLRKDGEGVERHSSHNIQVRAKSDKPGIDVIVAPGTKNEAVHIPVMITLSGVIDVVYNTIIIGEGADVTVIAGCGIHNSGSEKSQHDGIHEISSRRMLTLYIENTMAKVKELAKSAKSKTLLTMEENSIVEMELVQIKGVDSTIRDTKAKTDAGASLIVTERLLTHGNQEAVSDMIIELDGKGANAQ